MRFGGQRVQQSIVERVVKAAKNAGSDPALLMSIADKESSFSSSAKASTCLGERLVPVCRVDWLKALRSFSERYGHEEDAKAIGRGTTAGGRAGKACRNPQVRNDPYLSAALAAEMLNENGAKIAERLGRALTAGKPI